MTESSVIVDQARKKGYLGFLGTPRAFGITQLNPDDVKYVAGEVGHDERVKTLMVRNLDIPNKSMQFLADIIAVTPSITNVLLYQNQFANEGAKELSEALAHNNTITKLNIGLNYFPFSAICDGIARCSSLTELDFSYLEMGEGTALDDFISAMTNNTTIKQMILFSNKFTERHGEKIGTMINTLEGLKSLDLSFNDLGDEGMDCICQAIKDNTHLTQLTIGANGLSSSCGKSVEDLLVNNTTLTSLNLIDNRIGYDGTVHIASALKSNSTLRELNLNKNCLGFDGFCALADGMKFNHGVRTLQLNRVIQTLPTGPSVGKSQSLFDMIATNTTLTNLNIGRMLFCHFNAVVQFLHSLRPVTVNPLGEELICSVCNGACLNKSLTSLCIQRVKFGTDKANDALCQMIENNHSLTSLSLSFCRLSDTVWPRFFESLSKNTCLMELSLRCTLNKPERIVFLRDYLCKNPCLQRINLCDNNIRVDECALIADVIRSNTRLTSINLDSNIVKVEGGKMIIDALEENHSIVDLFHQDSYIGGPLFSRMEELIARNKTWFKPEIETFVTGTTCEDSPLSLIHDIPVLTKFISYLALPDWHPQSIIDKVFSD